MSSASLRLTEPCVFLVGGLDWERARQRQRRAAQRAANAANAASTPTNAGPSVAATVGSPSQSRHPSPDRAAGSRAASLSRPGSRAASPAPRGRLGELAAAEDFVPPNSRGRSHSRTRQPTPGGTRANSLSRGRDGSLVREMTEAQLALQQEREEREDLDEPPPALLRGLLTVHLSKPTRVKEISVRFKGTARTDWPEGALFLSLEAR